MRVFGLNLTEIIAIVSFFGGVLFGLMKFYHMFSRLEETMTNVEEAIKRLNDHEVRISVLEEQNEFIFKSLGGATNEKN